jgi:Zn-dependent protease
MLRSWKIGSAFGIGVYVHSSFLLFPLLVLFTTAGSPLGPLFYQAVVLAIFGCVVLHEFGHALMARCFGIRTRDITMYPIGGVARLERMSERPWEEFCIAVAGPLVNVVIALVLEILKVGVALINPALLNETLPGLFLQFLLASNVLLVVFNMIPAFPMDGGRVLRALLSASLGHLRATRIAAGVAAVMAVLLVLVGVGYLPVPLLGPNPVLVVVAGFVFLMGQRELQMVEMRERLRREEPLEVLPVRRAPAPEVVLDLQPTVSVYIWDNVNGVWVKEGPSRPARRPRLGDLP